MDSLQSVWYRRKWPIISAFLLLMSAAVGLIMSLPEMYRSSTTILLGQDVITESFVTSANSMQLEQRLHVIQQEIMSRESLLEIIETHNLYESLRATLPAEASVNRMRRDVSLNQTIISRESQSRGQPSPVEVRISYQGWDARQVAEVTNALAEILREKFEILRFGQASRTTEFLEQQLESVGLRVAAQEERVNGFRQQNLGQLPQQEGIILSALDRLNSDLRLNGERQVQLITRRNDALSQIDGFGARGGLTGESRVDFLRRELSVMGARYSDRHPGIIRLQEEINVLERQPVPAGEPGYEVNTTEELRRLREQESVLRANISELQLRIQEMPAIGQTLGVLTNNYATVRDEQLLLQRRLQDARLAESLEAQQTQQFQIIEPAVPANYSFLPDRLRLMIMSLFLVTALIAGLVFLAEQLDQSFNSVKELRAFSAVPVLTSIPRIRSKGETLKRGAGSVLLALLFLVVVAAVASFTYSAGQNAQQLVWFLSGSNTL